MAKREELQALLERVEAATGMDKGLAMDFAAVVLGGEWRPYRKGARSKWLYSTEGRVFCYGHEEPLRWFSSIDAALALVERVLPSWAWSIGHDGNDELFASLWDGVDQYSGYATTPPLALLAALLEVLIAQEAVDA